MANSMCDVRLNELKTMLDAYMPTVAECYTGISSIPAEVQMAVYNYIVALKKERRNIRLAQGKTSYRFTFAGSDELGNMDYDDVNSFFEGAMYSLRWLCGAVQSGKYGYQQGSLLAHWVVASGILRVVSKDYRRDESLENRGIAFVYGDAMVAGKDGDEESRVFDFIAAPEEDPDQQLYNEMIEEITDCARAELTPLASTYVEMKLSSAFRAVGVKKLACEFVRRNGLSLDQMAERRLLQEAKKAVAEGDRLLKRYAGRVSALHAA